MLLPGHPHVAGYLAVPNPAQGNAPFLLRSCGRTQHPLLCVLNTMLCAQGIVPLCSELAQALPLLRSLNLSYTVFLEKVPEGLEILLAMPTLER